MLQIERILSLSGLQCSNISSVIRYVTAIKEFLYFSIDYYQWVITKLVLALYWVPDPILKELLIPSSWGAISCGC